jgi:hypothetical protein
MLAKRPGTGFLTASLRVPGTGWLLQWFEVVGFHSGKVHGMVHSGHAGLKHFV